MDFYAKREIPEEFFLGISSPPHRIGDPGF